MSNGIDKNPLLDISRVYLDQIAEKKDDSYLEPDMKKRQANNEKARKEMEKVKGQKNPHFEEKDPFGRPGGKHGGVPKKGGGYDKAYQANMKKVKELDKKEGWDAVNALADAYKEMYQVDENRAAMGRIAREYKQKKEEEGMKKRMADHADKMKNDPEYAAKRRAQDKIHREELELDENRRAARAAGGYKDDSKKQNDPSKAGFTGVGNMSIDQIRKMSARMDKEKKESYDPMDDPDFDHDEAEKNRGVSGKNNPKGGKALSKKKKMKEGLDPVGKEDGDVNNDGKKDKTDKYLMNRRKAIGNAIKGKMKKEETDVDKYIETVSKVKEAERKNDVQRWIQKESNSSNWRQDLSEIMTDDIDSKPIKEKNVKNKIKINPKLGEAIEQIGGTIVEMVEVGEAVYGGEPEKKKDDRMIVTNADKKANTPAYRAYKAGNKKYKSADHMNEGVEEYVDFLITEGYDCSDLTWDDMYEEYQSLDEGLRSAVKRLLGKKKEEPAKPMSRGDQLRKKYNVGPEKSDTSAKAQILKKTRAKADSDQKEFGGSRYSKGVADKSKAAHERQLKGGYSKYGADDARGKGNKARKRAAALTKEEASMSPQEIALQKKKAMLDRMIAQKRQQGLNKVKKSEAPAKAMGEEVGCTHTHKGKECPVHGKKDCSSMKEATEDSLRDRRMERGGVDGNNRYDKPISNTPNTFGKKKPASGGMSALEKVKASIRAKHGHGAIKEDAKMAKQSDEKLAALHKQVSGSDQSLPSNQFMMKRVTKEMNRRKKAT